MAKKGGSGRTGWVVSKMVLGQAYTAKDVQLMLMSPSAPFDPVTRKEAKAIVYGILRSKCYSTQVSDVKRKGVILLRPVEAAPVEKNCLQSLTHVFHRACSKLQRAPAGRATLH